MDHRDTMRFGSTAKDLAECNLKYCRISECGSLLCQEGRQFLSEQEEAHIQICCAVRDCAAMLMSLLLAYISHCTVTAVGRVLCA